MGDDSVLVQYHRYAWRRFRPALVESLVVNYVLPGLVEFLPWMVSRRKVARRLRERRTTIEHVLIGNGRLPRDLLLTYLGEALLYGILCAIDAHLRDHVHRRSRALLERQVLERLMSTDLQAIGIVYKRVYGIDARTDLVHKRLREDLDAISRTVNETLPGAARTMVAFIRSIGDLYPRRHQIDYLAVSRPTLLAAAADVYRRLQGAFLPTSPVNMQPRDDLVSGIVDRLSEIQSANLQDHHLVLLDKIGVGGDLVHDAIAISVENVTKAISNHSVVEFASEALVARRALARTQIDHESYRKVQNDVNYSVQLLWKAASLVQEVRLGLGQSAGLCALLALKPYRMSPSPTRKVLEFAYLRISSLFYQYGPGGPIALSITRSVSLQRGRFFALLGPNGAGKTTLTRILMKLLPPGPKSRISVDGVTFASIERSHYRHHICYVSQQPYIIAGSIADNIRLGHPDATDAQIEAAAKSAGVFLFNRQLISNGAAANSSAETLPSYPDLMALALLMTSSPEEATSPGTSLHPVLLRSIDTVRLSSAMVQAIALSRVFLSDERVRVVILDEALSMMDPVKAHSFVLPELLRFVRARKMMLIMATHDQFVFSQADGVLIMENGEIVEQGAPSDLMAARSPPYLKICGLTGILPENTFDQL